MPAPTSEHVRRGGLGLPPPRRRQRRRRRVVLRHERHRQGHGRRRVPPPPLLREPVPPSSREDADLDSGANISRLNSSAWARILAHPRLLRIVLAAGADFTASCVDGMTPEDSARASIAAVRSYNSNRAAIFEETASILEGVRLAGSYKQYVLQDYTRLLRLRSLLAREDRALIGPRNPDVVARLFGGRFDAWATFPHQRLAGVPDPAFLLVMEYWRLGDWRRPRA